MRIIVTGGAGFIGSHLVDKLIEQGAKLIVIDNLSTGKRENLNSKADFHQLDISDFEKIKLLFQNQADKIDYVFHLAAIPRVPVSIEDPVGSSRTNILGAVNVFKAAKDNNVKRVIFASSSSVYGDQKQLPLRESMEPDPISPYALKKLVGEKFAKMFFELYGIPIISLRYFNVYGPRLDPNSEYSSVIGKFLKLKNQNKPLTIFGNGEQTRGFCYIDDVIEANIKAMESDELKGGEVINIGSYRSYSVNYLAKLFKGEVEYLPFRPGDICHSRADIGLAKELLDWDTKVSFEQGIKKTQEWFNNYL